MLCRNQPLIKGYPPIVIQYADFMSSIFCKIIDGDLPSRMVWEDDKCVAILDIRPLAPGHVLVIPRVETDQWTDLAPDLASHLMTVAHSIGRAQMRVFSPARIGMVIAGFEVPHAHMHVVPVNSMSDLDFELVNPNPDQGELDSHLEQLRESLEDAGYASVCKR